MRIKSILLLLVCFLLSGLTMPAIACPPPYCGSCCHWVSTGPGPSDGYCDLNLGAECGDCQGGCYNPCNNCVSCSCEWDCSPTQYCCTDSGDYCCESSETCCEGSCCINVCCNGICCGLSWEICCNGTCCDIGNCCNDETCCAPGGDCCTDADDAYCCYAGLTCCQGNCCDPFDEICCEGDCCDKDLCEECVDGECKVCGGDPDLKCCFPPWRSCNNRCELELTGACATSNNEDCPSCYPGDCSATTTKVYTGNDVYSCKYHGCPGDCVSDDDVLCYTEYKCKNWFSPNEEQCLWHPIMQYYMCFPREGHPEWRCDMCELDGDDPGEPHMEPSEKCVG